MAIARSVRPAIIGSSTSSRPNSRRNARRNARTPTPPASTSVWSTSHRTSTPSLMAQTVAVNLRFTVLRSLSTDRCQEAGMDNEAELRRDVVDLMERLTKRIAGHLTLPDPTPKIGDADEEYRARVARLRRVRAAQLAEALVEEVSADFTAREAAGAVWLGASLADLGAASGSTRQAARKRWPDLGLIYRTRRWLGSHHDGVLAAAVEADGPQPARWQRLAEAVDRHLRDIVARAVPTTPEASRALDGAAGTVA